MYLTGADLIDLTLEQLRMLEEILREDAHTFAAQRDAAGHDARRCREATEAIRVLIPKLVAARATQQPQGQLQLPGCANEDEL
jgi:hypothetical protein